MNEENKTMNFLEENKKYWERQEMGEDRMCNTNIETFKKLIENLLENFKRKKILDFGCGTGRMYPIFNELNADYFGIDTSPKLLNLFKIKYPEADFILIDGFKTPIKESFDIIWCWSIFTHYPIEDIKEMLKEFKRLLKENGTVYVSYIISTNPEEDCHEVNFFTHRQKIFEETIIKSGFKFKDTGILFPNKEAYNLKQTLMELKK